MTGLEIVLAGGAIAILAALWTLQRSKHPFDLRDTLLDASTGRASLNACILWLSFLLSAWVVVDREQDNLADVPTLLLGVLGIFVAGKAVAQGINAFKPGDGK